MFSAIGTLQFVVISLIMLGIDIGLGHAAREKGSKEGSALGLTCYCAAVVVGSYILSVAIANQFLSSLFASIYFIGIDAALLCLLRFIVIHVKMPVNKSMKTLQIAAITYFVFDVVIMFVNPVCEIAVRMIPREGVDCGFYAYDILPLYTMHLAYCYALIALTIGILGYKAKKTPRDYRRPYVIDIVGLLVIVLINGLFLYWQLSSLDLSLWIYSLAAAFMYWSSFYYVGRGVQDRLRADFFEAVSQGIIRFDYQDKLIVWNDRARTMLPDVTFHEGVTWKEFVDWVKLPINGRIAQEGCSFQFYAHRGDSMMPVRCDYRLQKDTSGKTPIHLGRLLVLTDAALESDMLTGFHNVDSFARLAADYPDSYNYPSIIVMMDISGLTSINASLGRPKGDQMISDLANAMRDCFPSGTYFIRGHEAALIAVKRGMNDVSAAACVERVRDRFESHFISVMVPCRGRNEETVVMAIENAAKGIVAKKMLDAHSGRSDVLNSLMRTLRECDSDTEAHVERTQKTGELLGQRMGLSDVERSTLSLLCMLHDIGKIGIPLEILNKPGKLTPSEWQIMQTHVEKGYQIAMSSEGLNNIADLIRHHHERWDGMGYPDGLSKESIPLLSRVIAVVDSFDAMTSNRSYRRAMSLEEAKKELRRYAGKQFDPNIVSEFLNMTEDEEFAQLYSFRTDNRPNELAITQAEQVEDIAEKNVFPMELVRYILDSSLNILSVGDGFEEMTGYSAQDVRSLHMGQIDLLPREDRAEYLATVNRILSVSDMAYIEHRLLRKDGNAITVLCLGRVFFSAADRDQLTEIIVTDIRNVHAVRKLIDEERRRNDTKMNRWEDKFRQDALTGLLTHEALKSDVTERVLAGNRNVMMIMMDLDHFKQFNDTFGHAAGDEYLILAAKTISEAVREGDYCCRMGGDEFAVVLFFKETPDLEANMRASAKRIFDILTRELKAANSFGSVSMGAARGTDDMASFKDLYEAADKALYDSKEGGRGRLGFGVGFTNGE